LCVFPSLLLSLRLFILFFCTSLHLKQLCNAQTDQEVARYTVALGSEGLYAGERKSRLRIQPGCSLDVELVVLSFLIMEKKRREKAGESSAMMIYHDEEPQGDGCADGDGGVGS
jgi:hypothetical protein